MRKLIFLMSAILMALPAMARDFSYEYNGQTLTYFVIDEEAKTCRVSKNTGVSGTLILPGNPKDGDTKFTLTEIAERAFSGCNSLTSVVIPPSVTTLGEDAFWPCTGLKKSAYPEHLDNPFEWGLTFSYPTDAAITNDGVVYDAAMTTLYFAPYTLTGEFTIAPTTTTIKTQALLDCNALNKIVVPPSVTSIEIKAFAGCGYLSEVIFEDGNSPVDYSPEIFDGCYASKFHLGRDVKQNTPITLIPNLSTLTIGNCVTELPEYAFCGCNSLTSVNIGNSIRSIGKSTFEGCQALTSIEIPVSVTSIGESAFSGCAALTSIEIPDAITEIAKNTFNGCTSMTSLSIGKSVSHIGEYAFSECSALTSVIIPYSVTAIWSSAFSGCENMTSMKMLCDTPPEIVGWHYSYQNPQIFLPNTTLELQTNEIIDLAEYFGWWHFKTIIVNGNPTKSYSIGGITYRLIENPDNREAVILGCESTSVINIPERITDISNPDNPVRYYVRAIAPEAFRGEPVQTIAFDSRAKIANIPAMTFFNCSSLNSIIIPNSVSVIGECAFYGCTSLSSIIIPNSVTSIEDEAFHKCPLTAVTIPNSVTEIGSHAFGCNSLKEFVIEDGESSIDIGYLAFGHYASYNDAPLESLYIGRTWTMVENRDGNGTMPTTLQKVTLGNQVKKIPNTAFCFCNNLTSIEIPDFVTEIGDYAFYRCPGLTSVVIGNSVTSIGENAFNQCSELNYIYSLNPEPPIVADNTFLNCFNLNTIYVPGGSEMKYQTAHGWSQYELRDLNLALGLVSAPFIGMAKGETYLFKMTASENLAVAGSDRWMSDNEAVATVDKDGIVTAVASGKANISCTVKARPGFEYTANYEVVVVEYRGDANGDDILAVNDVVLTARAVVNDIDPSLLLWAVDFNHDNRVTVGDLSRVIDGVVSYTAPAQASDRHYLRALQAAGMASPLSLSMDGSNVTVAMGGDGRFAGVQFDVVGDDGLTVTSVTLSGDATRSHFAANHRLETGVLRMLAYGTESFESDCVFATIHTKCTDLKPRKLTLTNVMASDFDGRLYRLPDCEIYLNQTSGIDSTANGGLSIAVEGLTLIITTDEPATVTITDLRGISTRLDVPAGISRHTIPSAGIYIVNNQKIIIR